MIKSSLRLAVLAVAALSLPAAAQSDAAFASALGKIPSGLATMAQLKTAPQAPAPAQVQGPTAPADVWRKVIATVSRRGTQKPVPDTDMTEYEVMDRFTTPKGTLEAYRAQCYVGPGENGQLDLRGAIFTFIQVFYDAATDTSRVELTSFSAYGSGRLIEAYHKLDIRKGKVLVKDGAPAYLDLADVETKNEFEWILDWWTKG